MTTPPKSKRLILFGTHGFAELAHRYFTEDSPYDVLAFTVDEAYRDQESLHGLPVVPFEGIEERYPPADVEMFVAAGITEVNQMRARKVDQAQAKGYRLASFVSTGATAPTDLEIGPNSMVMEHAGVHPFVKIGKNSMIWSSTQIGFRSVIGDHCWLVGPLLGESVHVGDYSFIGLHATVSPFVRIARSNVIGARSFIGKDTSDFEVYAEKPTRPSRVPSHRLRSLR